MKLRRMAIQDYARAVGVGIATGVLLSLIVVPASKTGISPLPKPLGLAFAQLLLGKVPLPVGLLFHLAYVTFWSVVYAVFFKRRTLLNSLWLALGLWLLVLVFFFPLVGWGIFGLNIGPKLIIASLIPHFLFAVILWGLCRWVFPTHSTSNKQMIQK